MKHAVGLFFALSLVVLVVLVVLPVSPAQAGGGDCIEYNPALLYVVQEGDHWLLTDGSMRMQMLDNQTDANHALAVAQRYTQQCFVGRDNTRPDRRRYITEYFGVASTLPVTAFTEDCIAFDPSTLSVAQNGNDWFVMSGNMSMSMFASQQEAQWMVTIIKGQGWNQQCFIGRDNTRADRMTYIMEYWKGTSKLIKLNPGILQILPTPVK